MMQMEKTAALLLVSLVQNAVFVGIAAFFLHRRGLSLRQAGLRRPTVRQVSAALAGGVLLFSGALIVEFAATSAFKALLPSAAFRELLRTSEDSSAEQAFLRLSAPLAKTAFVLLGVLIAPIGEEIFFRGWIYTALRARGGVVCGIAGSGLIFGLAHLSPLGFCGLFPMGMLLAYAYERTGSLWITITLHATNNLLAFALLWLLPQWAG